MYFVVNLCENQIIAEGLTYLQAVMALEDAVEKSNGFYVDMDFAICDAAELQILGIDY